MISIDQNVTQQLAALVAVVSVAIIGVAMLLISPTWKRFEQTSFGLTIPEKRIINRIILLSFGPLLLFIFITNFIGVYAPGLFQPAARILYLLVLVIWIISILSSQVIKWIRKSKPSPKLASLPFMYRITLVWLILCIFFCLIALIGVTPAMLNIEIGPFNQDNYNWGRWFLFDGIIYFFIGIFCFAFASIEEKIKVRKPANNIGGKKSIVWRIAPLAVVLCLIITGVFTIPNQFKDDGSSFLNAFLSIPLDVKASVNISGTQFKVKNESDFDWEIVTLSLNKDGLSSGYTLDLESIKQEETYIVDITEFADSSGMRFNLSTMKPLRCSIDVRNSLGQSGTFSAILRKSANN